MEAHLYQKINHIISLIPSGKVATYGQIAEIVGGCTARMVGYATSAVPQYSDIPWQRVINYKGEDKEAVVPEDYSSKSCLKQKVLNSIKMAEQIWSTFCGKENRGVFKKLQRIMRARLIQHESRLRLSL